MVSSLSTKKNISALCEALHHLLSVFIHMRPHWILCIITFFQKILENAKAFAIIIFLYSTLEI